MKKHIFAGLCVVTAILLGSCALLDYLPTARVLKPTEALDSYLQVVPDEVSYSKGYEPVQSSYSYDALPLEGEKSLYERLCESCYDISSEKDADTDRYPMPQVKLDGYPLSEAEVRTVIKALTDDHPEIFWLTGTMGYYSDYETTIVQLYASYSPEEVDQRVNAVRAAANDFYQTVPDGLSEYEREKLVHDYLLDHLEYDRNVDTIDFDNNDPDIYTVYGALVNGLTVCEGYARSFQMLMNGLGIDCVGVMGESSDQMHIWNSVKLGDNWYNVDATWNDREEPYARYLYFNVTDDELYSDHTLSPMFDELSDSEINGEEGKYSASVMNLFVPECHDRQMGYYYRESPHLADYEGAEVKVGLLTSAQKQEDYFVFYIEESLDYHEAVSQLFTEYPQYFFGYLNAVNNTLPDYSIDSSNASYYTHEKSRIVAVELHYY